MQIRFVPPELASASQAEVLREIVVGMAPAGIAGEICATQFWRDSPLQLSLAAPGCPPLHVALERHWLFCSGYTDAIKQRVEGLFHRYQQMKS